MKGLRREEARSRGLHGQQYSGGTNNDSESGGDSHPKQGADRPRTVFVLTPGTGDVNRGGRL